METLFSSQNILPIVIAASFAAGLNVYATVATLGLLSHAHVFELPPALHLVGTWPVILVSSMLFGLGFVADKVPLVDLFWNALNTFVRIPVAALISFGASQHLSPAMQAVATALGGAVALAAHSGKIAVRAAVTPSPEPISNAALSFAEDVAAIGLTWLATQHPFIAGTLAAICVVALLLAMRYVIRSLGRFFQQIRSTLRPILERF